MSIEVELDSRRGKEAILKSSHFTASTSWVSVVEGMLGRANLLGFSVSTCPLTASKCPVRNRTDHTRRI